MSSQANDENERLVNKLLIDHPEISVDRSIPSSPTIASNLNSKTSAICIVSTSNQDLKQCGDSKLPPYVNSSRLPTRTNKNVSTNQPSKSVSPKLASSEKSASSIMSDTVRLLSNKKNVTVEVMRQPSSNQIPCPSSGDSVSTSVPNDEAHNFPSLKPKPLQEQVSSRTIPSTVLEKNISNNVLTVTQCVSPKSTSTTTLVSYLDGGKCIARSSPTTAVESVKNQLLCQDTVATRGDTRANLSSTKVENTPANSVKEDSAKMISKIDPSRVEITKKSPVIMDTSEIADKIAKKTYINSSVNVDSSKNSVAPQVINSQRAKELIAASKSKNFQTSTTPIKTEVTKSKPVTINVSNVPISSSTQTMADSTQTASSNNLAKEAMEALNAGDDYALTNSVTISNPAASISNEHLSVPTSGDIKLRNIGSENNVAKVPNNTNPSFGSDGDGNGDPDSSLRNNAVRSPSICVPTVSSSSSALTSTSPTNSLSISDDAKIQKMREIRVRKEIQNSNLQQNAVQSTDLEEENVTKVENSSNKIDDSVECLTISSDDDEDANEIADSYTSNVSEEDATSISLLGKEPSIEDDDEEAENADIENVDGMLDDIADDDAQLVECRSARIGSYRSQLIGPVALSRYGVRMVIPAVNDDSRRVVLKIPIKDIKKMLVNFGQPFPSIFYYVSPQCGARVRHMLNMLDSSYCYFDPTSKDESLKRITLLLEDSYKMEADRIKSFYSYPDCKVMALLNPNEANELLLKSSPKEVRRSIQRTIKTVPQNKVQTIMVFPPPPAKGGISINTEDYSCLAEDVFLNDVIIDFYLKYLYLYKLKDGDREKTHIFSSFFYKRLTDKATPMAKNFHGSKTGDSTITKAEVRHSRVKNWTKNIDLFEKDFIIIPLNENQHWFLAIICYPGLRGPVSIETNEPIQTSSTNSNENQTMVEVVDGEKQETMTIGSTTITPIKNESATKVMTVVEDEDDEDRDEADGAEEEEHLNQDSGEDLDAYSDTSSGEVKPRVKPKRAPIKQPCILIFDSLAGASRANIIATLRQYLDVEYRIKHGEVRDFSHRVVKGNCPKVPQQNNFTDCGLFVLQYVESFFENKITDYNLPIRMLREWFEPDTVSSKRYEIQQLLLRLMREQDIDIEELGLPHLHLSPVDTDDSSADYYEEDVDYDEEDEDIEGYGPSDEDEYEDEEEEMGEHDFHGMHYRMDVEPDSEDEDEYDGGSKMHWLDEDSYGAVNDDDSGEEGEECDIYKNMDDIGTVESGERSRRTPTSTTHRALKREFDERRQRRIDLDAEVDDEEESDGEDIKLQERLFGGNDDVTISVASGSSMAVGDASNVLDPVTLTTTAATATDRKLVMEELKAARPFYNRDGSEDSGGCSSSKKFKSH